METTNGERRKVNISEQNDDSFFQSSAQSGDSLTKVVFRQPQIEEHKGTASSIQIIFSMVNCTVGSGVLVLPILFQQAGLATALIIELIYGFVNYKTTSIYLKHLLPSEIDVQITVRRILGKNWWYAFNISSVASLVFQNMIYFYFLNEMLFKVIEFPLLQSGLQEGDGFKYDEKNVICQNNIVIFNLFSLQYLAFGTLLILGPLIFIKNLGLIVRVNSFGVYALYAYFIFVLYVFIDNIINNSDQILNNVNWCGWKFGALAGAAAQGFSLQYIVGPIARQAAVPENNVRNCGYSYIISATIYILCGGLGLFGISGRQKPASGDPSTLLDYFTNKSPAVFVVALLFVLKLITVFPLTVEPQRQRILEMIFGKKESEAKKKAGNLHNVIFLALCFLPIYVPQFNINVLMTIGGAVCSFVFVYAVPIFMHIKCYHYDKEVLSQLPPRTDFLDSMPDDTQLTSVIYQDKHLEDSIFSDDSKNQAKDNLSSQNGQSKDTQGQNIAHQVNNCQKHTEKQIDALSLTQRQAIYSFLGIFGVFTMILGLYVVGVQLSKH